MTRFLSRLILSGLLVALSACATFKTFNEKVALGYTTVTQVRDTTKTLLESDHISVNDAQNVQKQADNVREGIDIAREMKANDTPGADNKLQSVSVALKALKKYLGELQ